MDLINNNSKPSGICLGVCETGLEGPSHLFPISEFNYLELMAFLPEIDGHGSPGSYRRSILSNF